MVIFNLYGLILSIVAFSQGVENDNLAFASTILTSVESNTSSIIGKLLSKRNGDKSTMYCCLTLKVLWALILSIVIFGLNVAIFTEEYQPDDDENYQYNQEDDTAVNQKPDYVVAFLK